MQSHRASKEEREWMDRIAEMGCVVCLKFLGLTTPPEIHHIAGKVKEGSHLLTIPLCHLHHRSGQDTAAFTSRHPFKSRFEERYGTEQELLEWTRKEIDRR